MRKNDQKIFATPYMHSITNATLPEVRNLEVAENFDQHFLPPISTGFLLPPSPGNQTAVLHFATWSDISNIIGLQPIYYTCCDT